MLDKKVLILPVFLALLLSAACSKDTSLEQKGSAEKAVTRLPITTPEVKEHPEYSSSLYKLDISSGAVSLLADNALRPVVAPDGKKVAVFAVDKPEKHVRISSIKILGLDGTVLHSIHVNEIEMSFFNIKLYGILLQTVLLPLHIKIRMVQGLSIWLSGI